MALTFQPGTKLLITDGLNRYELLVKSATANQTYNETSQSVKTIHNKNLVERTFVNEKSAASLSFSCFLTTTGVSDGILFDWFGFEYSSGKYNIVPNSIELKAYDIYIDAGNTIYKLAGSVAENISFKLSRKEILSVDVTAVASDLVEVGSIPTLGSLHTQKDYQFQNGTTSVTGYSGLAGITCEVTRSISWASQKTIHDTIDGGIYTVSNPILESLAISGSITTYKVDSTNTYTPDTSVDIIYNNSFQIHLDSCKLSDRWVMGTVHQKVTDYKLLPTAVNAFIKF